MTTTAGRVDHPVALRTEARRMHRAGWSAHRIHQMFRDRLGADAPARATVYNWTDEQAYERHKRSVIAGQARRRSREPVFRLYGSTPDYQAAFIERLRSEDVAVRAIAAVCRVVFDDPSWTYARVRYVLEGR